MPTGTSTAASCPRASCRTCSRTVALLLLADCGHTRSDSTFGAVASGDGGTQDGAASTGDAATDGSVQGGDGSVSPGCAGAGPFGGRTFTVLNTTLHITAGGTYQNLFVTSPDSDSAAIEIETTDPVVLRFVRGNGPGNVVHAQAGFDVTIENSA